MERKEIESKAIELVRNVKYIQENDDVDVIKIADLLGIKVGNALLDDDADGFIIVDERQNEILGIQTSKLIGVNSKRSIEWKRFIVAHEIAHYVLHYSIEINKGMYAHRDHRKGKSAEENDADFFAANLLMPREKFSKKFKELKDKSLSIDEIAVLLAKKFVVTFDMAERRIGELELKNE